MNIFLSIGAIKRNKSKLGLKKWKDAVILTYSLVVKIIEP
jgi:hypothetical protein